MSGLSVGILSGLVVSGVALVALSLSTPLPPRPVAQDVPALEVAVGADGADPEAPAEDAAPEADAPAAGDAPAADPAADETDPAEAEPDDNGANTAPATDIPLPSGSEFNRPPPEEEAALPETDTAPNAASPEAPIAAGPATVPAFDTAPAAQPNVATESPGAIGSAPALGDAPTAPAGAEAFAVSESGPSTLRQPQASASPQVQTTTVPRPAAEEVNPDTATPNTEIAALEAAEPETPNLEAPQFPEIGEAATPDESVPLEDSAETATPRLPTVTRFPQAGGSAEEEPDAEPETEGVEEILAEDLPAIEAFGAPFEPEDTRPLMAVVLIDEPDSGLDLETLTRFTFPVAFAIDPLHPEAEARAAVYREAGFEVVILGAMLPEGATAVDTEVALVGAQAILPEAVALLDTPDHRIQGDRRVLDATVASLADTGHGLVAFPRGLNAAEQTAARDGVPGATLFRLLDGADERATTITRFLSRAAFVAAQEGTVVVAGHTRPDTVTALFSWALGDRSEAVALAPLSATLLRATE